MRRGEDGSATEGGESSADPLAPWRHGAPWSEEDQQLWQQYLDRAEGDEELALKELSADAEALAQGGCGAVRPRADAA